MSVYVNSSKKPAKIAIIASNPTTSEQTGWSIGFWWEEVTDPYFVFTNVGYDVDIVSSDGGELQGDAWSDPRDESQYSAHDLVSMGFIHTPSLMEKITNSTPLSDINPDDYDAILLAGGQGPMYTFFNDEILHTFVVDFYESGKPTAVVCHATCILLKTKTSDGKLLVDGKTWTGFANSEEDYADNYVGQAIQPFRIEDEARKLGSTNFIVQNAFSRHAVRDGNLITGQQQYSSGKAAERVIEVLGV